MKIRNLPKNYLAYDQKFGAFFYHADNSEGEKYLLYTISGVPKEAFSKFPNPRNTKIFGPTFSGTHTVRYGDVTRQPHFGKNAPYHGMPEGHLPVKSYLAVPVISPNTKAVIGGLFFGHPEPDIFTEASEKMVEGIAAQGAIAMENARLFEEKNRTEQKLRESEMKFRDMADTVPVMIWVTDQEGQCTNLNKQWYDYTGQTEATALGQKWANALHPDDVEKTMHTFLEASKSQKAFSLSFRLKNKTGNFRWTLVTGFPKFDGAGNFEGIIGAVVDIHERKMAEEALDEQKQQYESIFNIVRSGLPEKLILMSITILSALLVPYWILRNKH